MNSVLGSRFEASLRMMVLLEAVYEESLTEGEIIAFDYIAVYARDYGISNMNLHGGGQYRFNEMAARRELIRNGLRCLVLDGLVEAKQTERGFTYSITSDGFIFAANLNNAYANEYYETAVKVIDSMRGKTEDELFRIINHRIVQSIRRT